MTPDVAPILQIFAREPIPGAVKTRLAATIGVERAAAIYRELTAVTLLNARCAHAAGVIAAIELWCAPSTASAWFHDCAAAAHASLHLQCDGDLGVRMGAALASGLTRADGVLLIGTDCPVLDASALGEAGELLSHYDAILGPAEDGGYVLVGARVPIAFDGVRMSTASTATDTLTALERAGIRCGLLPLSWDVDVAADLDRWERMRGTINAATG
ncbi:MAG: TIGR04282 family arsenosugar biosynthesis glycosyltransferase [Betaproteobacteria bacterium]